jgi:long-chain acyl-CoA synthetase
LGYSASLLWFVTCSTIGYNFTDLSFVAAIEAKWQLLNFFGKPNALTNAYDSILFRQISDVTGGNLKYGLSGGAPVSFETQKFITSTLCFMLQGYG